MKSDKRIPIEDRWSGDSRKWVKGVPWIGYKGDEYQDGEVPEGVEAEEIEENEEDKKVDMPPVVIQTRALRPRDF